VSNKPRILIADDSRIVRATIAQHIRARFDVREVTDGESAWQAVLLDASIKVLISDLTMPKVDGFELLSRVRASKLARIRELPVIVISGADERAECERAAALGATDFIQKGVQAAELISRLEVLIKLADAREQLAESRNELATSRTTDPDTELLALPFFDKQFEKLIAFSRRNGMDVAAISFRIELSTPQSEAWEGESDNRMKLVGRALAASVRLEDIATRADRYEFCVATQADGLASVLRFAARLRKVLENAEAAGPGVEVWTCIGVAALSEDPRRTAEELRQISQKRALQAQTSRSRRIVMGTGEAAVADRAEDSAMDIGLALTLIRSGRGHEVLPHLGRLMHSLRPLLALARQQRESEEAAKETVVHGSVQGVPRPVNH
jgi:two-component system, cell cycle response regulator